MKVDTKSWVGDWETDTAIGMGHSGVLAAIVERVTQFTLTAQVKDKHRYDDGGRYSSVEGLYDSVA
ncbi:hypothetical protein [uncultured Microbulbifer sp.]|uniref:hypothetical protein n=1 Tax=uncultured Microbulbifer sp. TaxID=348147 RepID=UPI002608CB3E|nr:hypothetical protein [uncultured Microbulbifer sp.]